LLLVGILFPHINDDARSKPRQISIVNYRTQVSINVKYVRYKGTIIYTTCSRSGAPGDPNIHEYYTFSVCKQLLTGQRIIVLFSFGPNN